MQLTPIASNMTQVDLNGFQVLFSYRTPVACLSDDNQYYRTEKFWSVTTSRHINKWLDGEIAKEKPQTFFDNLTLTTCPNHKAKLVFSPQNNHELKAAVAR